VLELCPAPVKVRLESLFKTLGLRRWGPAVVFGCSDIARLIKCHPRQVVQVMEWGLYLGYFREREKDPEGRPLVQLTASGTKCVNNQYYDAMNPKTVNEQNPNDNATLTHTVSDNPNNSATLAIGGVTEDLSSENAPSENATLAAPSSGIKMMRGTASSDPERSCPQGSRANGAEGHSARLATRVPNIPDPETQRLLDRDLSRARARARSENGASFQRASIEDLIRASRAPVQRNVRLADSADRARVYAMSQTYNVHLRWYRNSWKVPNSTVLLSPGNQQYTCFLRAAELADELGVSCETFVRAQFFWFDRWFLREPRIWELIGVTPSRFNAIERVRAYQAEIAAGAVDPEAPIVGQTRAAPEVSLAVRYAFSERTLKRLMTVHQKSEEEILRIFAKGDQAQAYFDTKWLRQNKTYQRLKNANEL